jgi:hypothetical protein
MSARRSTAAFAGGGGFARVIHHHSSSHQLLTSSNQKIVAPSAILIQKKDVKFCSATVLIFLRKSLNLFLCTISRRHKKVCALPRKIKIPSN